MDGGKQLVLDGTRVERVRSSPGQLADLAVLSADYFSVAEEEIKNLESVLTIVGGKPVYAAEEFADARTAASACAAGMVSGRGLWRLLQTRDSAGYGLLVS